MKRKHTIIDTSTATLARNILAGVGALSTVVGGYLMVANPQFTDTARDENLYSSAIAQEEIVLEDSQISRTIGLSVGALGAVSLALSLKLDTTVKFDRPEEVGQAAKKVPSTPQVQLTEDQDKRLKDKLLEEVFSIPWLAKLTKCPSIVVVGQTGSGKSRTMMAVLTYLAMLTDAEIIIGDPDAFQNLDQEAWIAGDVYGVGSTDVEQQNQVLAAINRFDDRTRTAKSKRLIGVWDEFSKWAIDYPLLAGKTQSVLTYALQANRKRNQQSVFLVHGLNKGIAGGKTESGIWNRLLSLSAVLYLPVTEEDDFGAPPRSESMWFKPPGKELDSTAVMPTLESHGDWQYHNLPKGLDSAVVQKHYGHLFDYFGISLRTFDQIKEGEKAQEMDKFVKRAETLPGVQKLSDVELLKRSFSLSFEGEEEEPIEDSSILDTLPEDAKKLYSYLQKSNKFDVNSAINLRDLLRFWGKTGGYTGEAAKERLIVFLRSLPGVAVSDDRKSFTWNLEGVEIDAD